MRYHHTCTKMAKMKKKRQTITKGGEYGEHPEFPQWWECKLMEPVRQLLGSIWKAEHKQTQ